LQVFELAQVFCDLNLIENSLRVAIKRLGRINFVSIQFQFWN
jgi:hypothetical protein